MRHNLPFLADKNLGVQPQTYVIKKRLELVTSAWSRFVEFSKLFKMLMDLKYEVSIVFNQLTKIERPVFFFCHC